MRPQRQTLRPIRKESVRLSRRHTPRRMAQKVTRVLPLRGLHVKLQRLQPCDETILRRRQFPKQTLHQAPMKTEGKVPNLPTRNHRDDQRPRVHLQAQRTDTLSRFRH